MEYQSGAVRPVGNIQDGWEIIKDDYWTFFLITLVATAIIIVAALILGLVNNVVTIGVSTVFGVTMKNAGDAGRISAAIVPQLISMVISIFTNIIIGVLSGVLFCGIYTALSRKASGGAAEFGDLFSGFQKFKACLIVAIVIALIQFVINTVMLLGGAALGFSAFGVGMLTKDGKFDPAILGGLVMVALAFFAVYFVVNLIISALTTFAYPLIADRDLSGGEALSLSIKGGFANLGRLILMLILLTLMALVGAMVCLVGVLFVMPILTAALFAAYQSVFGKTQRFYQNTPPPPPIFNNQPGY